jgi:hypothetical protein
MIFSFLQQNGNPPPALQSHFNRQLILKKRLVAFKGTNHPTANVSALQELGLGGQRQRFQGAPTHSLIEQPSPLNELGDKTPTC